MKQTTINIKKNSIIPFSGTKGILATMREKLGVELSSGNPANGVKYIVSLGAIGANVVGDYFVSDGTEVLDASNKVRPVLIADESGVENDLTVYGSPTETFLGSLKALDFGTNTDKYLQSAKILEGAINYLVAYKNSAGISVNNSQDITTDDVGSIVSDLLLLGKNGASYFSGLIATTFASLQTMTASEKTKEVDKLLYLAKTIAVYKGVGATETDKRTCDLEDTNFIGTLYTEDGSYPSSATKVTDSGDFRYYDSATNLIYAPLPITLKDNMINDLDVSGSKVLGVTNTRQFELGLDKLMFNSQKIQSGGIAVSLNGSNTAVATSGDVITLNMKNPSSGRVLGYIRVKNASDYTHKFYVDTSLVDTITSTNEFENSQLYDIPIDVNGSQLTITPSNFVIDDLIVDDKEYVKDQMRAFFLSDEIVDDLNVKTKIAGVKNFSNQIIYSVESSVPTELQELADANKDIKTVKTITTT